MIFRRRLGPFNDTVWSKWFFVMAALLFAACSKSGNEPPEQPTDRRLDPMTTNITWSSPKRRNSSFEVGPSGSQWYLVDTSNKFTRVSIGESEYRDLLSDLTQQLKSVKVGSFTEGSYLLRVKSGDSISDYSIPQAKQSESERRICELLGNTLSGWNLRATSSPPFDPKAPPLRGVPVKH